MKGIFNKQGKMDRWQRNDWDVYTYQCCPIELPDGTFRLYYQCYGAGGNADSGPAVVESNSINGPWTKPIVGEIEYPAGSGDFDNNLVIWRDSTGAVPYEFIDIIHDGTEYIALGMNKAVASSQIWTSPDGLVFTFGATIFTGSSANGGEYAEPKGILYDGVTYKVYYRSMPGGTPQRRSIGYYESVSSTSGFVDQGFLTDFISTSGELQYYDFRAEEHNGAWWGFFPLYKASTEQLGPIMLHRSLDSGATWEPRGMALHLGYVDPANHPVRTSGAEGEFDSVMTVASKPILVGGNWYLIYGASPQAHDTWPRPMEYGVATQANFDKKYDADLTFHAPFESTGQLLPLVGPQGVCDRAGSGRTYFDEGGKLIYAVANEVALDHDPITHKCLGLSIFEGITALVTQPGSIDHADWTKDGVTIDANVAENVDGLTLMDRMVVTDVSGRHRAYQQVTLGGVVWCDVGAFVKDDGARFVGLLMLGAADDWASIIVDLELGTIVENVGLAGSISESGIDLVGDGVYRIWMVAVVATANPFIIPQFHTSLTPAIDTGGGETMTGVIGEDFFIDGVTCHAATYHRPYAPSSAVQDKIDYSDVSWVNDSAGTWYVELTPARLDADSFAFEMGASISDSITFWFDQPTGTIAIFKGTATGNDGFISIASAAVKGERLKIAIAYANNDMVAYVNGVAGTPDATVQVPQTNSSTWLRIGSRLDDTLPFCGLVHDMRYFEVRKADAIVEAMSNGNFGLITTAIVPKNGGAGFGKMGAFGAQ